MKLIILTILVITFLSVISVIAQDYEVDNNQKSAQEIWEKAIEAKGGREKLYSVKNILEEQKDLKYVSLHVFPNKLWRRSDGPSPFGLYVEMYNGDSKLFYSIEKGHSLQIFNDRAVNVINIDAELLYLLETQRTKPIPYKTLKGKHRRKKVDIVFTKINTWKAKPNIYIYYFDEKTHLPLVVALADSNEKILSSDTFEDYINVEGIQMPQKRFGKKQNYQLNVEYREGLFDNPPKIENGSDFWKKL